MSTELTKIMIYLLIMATWQALLSNTCCVHRATFCWIFDSICLAEGGCQFSTRFGSRN